VNDLRKTKKQLIAELVELRHERTEAERKWHEHEKLVSALLDSPIDFAAVISTDWLLLDVSASMARRLGKTPDELRNTRVWDLVSPNLAETRKTWFRQVFETGEPVRFQDERAGTSFDNVLLPVKDADGNVVAATVWARDITNRKRMEEELQLSREELRALAQRVSEVSEAERRRMSRELHDRIGQSVTALNLALSLADDAVGSAADPELRDRIDQCLSLTDEIAERVSNLMTDLRPPLLDDYGLLSALRWYAGRFAEDAGVPVTVTGDDNLNLSKEQEEGMFRIAQEALHNVRKHARATRVAIHLTDQRDSMALRVEDNGIGFTVPEPSRAAGSGRERSL